MSTKIWDTLDPQVQTWVQQAADESSEFQRELWAEKTVEALEQAKVEGVTVYEVDQSLFSEKVQPMYDELNDEVLKALVKRIREVRP